MARREAEYFGEQELRLIQIATTLQGARRVEHVLTDAQLDYLVESDQYAVSALFRRPRVGAFFYVAPDQDEPARDALRRAGLTPHEA